MDGVGQCKIRRWVIRINWRAGEGRYVVVIWGAWFALLMKMLRFSPSTDDLSQCVCVMRFLTGLVVIQRNLWWLSVSFSVNFGRGSKKRWNFPLLSRGSGTLGRCRGFQKKIFRSTRFHGMMSHLSTELKRRCEDKDKLCAISGKMLLKFILWEIEMIIASGAKIKDWKVNWDRRHPGWQMPDWS